MKDKYIKENSVFIDYDNPLEKHRMFSEEIDSKLGIEKGNKKFNIPVKYTNYMIAEVEALTLAEAINKVMVEYDDLEDIEIDVDGTCIYLEPHTNALYEVIEEDK